MDTKEAIVGHKQDEKCSSLLLCWMTWMSTQTVPVTGGLWQYIWYTGVNAFAFILQFGGFCFPQSNLEGVSTSGDDKYKIPRTVSRFFFHFFNNLSLETTHKYNLYEHSKTAFSFCFVCIWVAYFLVIKYDISYYALIVYECLFSIFSE